MGSTRLAVSALLVATFALGCAGTESLDESSASTDEAAQTGKADRGFQGHYPSPTIVREGSKYHAWFAKETVAGTSYHVPHASFTDDGKWTFHGEALPHLGKQADENGVVWAPAAAQISENRWMLYYSAHLQGTEEQKCIWRAHATDPHGPFIDDYDGPIICQPDSLWAIDPYLVMGDGGNWHLAARLDEPGGINTIQIRRLDVNGDQFESGSNWNLLTRNAPDSWEQPVLENAGIVELTPPGAKDGHWFVFYSARAWAKDNYAIGYADCGTRISGEDHGAGNPRCTKITTTGPWMQKDASQGLYGPGTPTFYDDEAGRTLMSIQAWQFKGGKSNSENAKGQIMRTYTIAVGADYTPQVQLVRVDR